MSNGDWIDKLFRALDDALGPAASKSTPRPSRDPWADVTRERGGKPTTPPREKAKIRGEQINGEKFISASDVLVLLNTEGLSQSATARAIGKYLYG